MRELKKVKKFWIKLFEILQKFEEDCIPDEKEYWQGYKDCLGFCIEIIETIIKEGGDE